MLFLASGIFLFHLAGSISPLTNILLSRKIILCDLEFFAVFDMMSTFKYSTHPKCLSN